MSNTPRTSKTGRLVGLAVGISMAVTAGVAGADATRSEPTGDPKGAPPAASGQSANASGTTHVWSARIEIPAGQLKRAQINCPQGQVVFGGGGSNTDEGNVVLTDSFPIGQGWAVYMKNNGQTAQSMVAQAVCGTFTPAG